MKALGKSLKKITLFCLAHTVSRSLGLTPARAI
jgi:hypothetical protein